MDPIGGIILSQYLISSDVPLLTSATLSELFFRINNDDFKLFLLGAATIGVGNSAFEVMDVALAQKSSPTSLWG